MTSSDKTRTPLEETGIKHDSDKLQWNLLPFSSLKEIVRVVDFGARKYQPNNWQLVTNPIERYSAALFRHLCAWMDGEQLDPETHIHHLAHAGCNILFLLWFHLHPDKIKK